MASFGFPDSWAVLVASSKAELEKKRLAFLQMAATRGFAGEADRLRVDHKWVVEKSKEDMNTLASALQRNAKSQGYSTQRELLGIMASFVQSMVYRIPPRVRRTRSGRLVKTGGITMPIETLYNGYGDCDTKSLLFASILANFPHQRLIFLIGDGHLFVGVRGTPRLNDHYVEIRGTRYVLIEMTRPWPVGRIPQKAWLNCRRNFFKTVEIVDTTNR
jgi:hypothetical protein